MELVDDIVQFEDDDLEDDDLDWWLIYIAYKL